MTLEKRLLDELLQAYPPGEESLVDGLLARQLEKMKEKVVVLDDDPTGVQTVHGVSVYTDWSPESIRQGFQEENRMFFILTNSRSFTEEETARAHREIGRHIAAAAREGGRGVILISRGDSTLRGHYPLETEVLKETLETEEGKPIYGEILIPFFLEGGRYTAEDIHYVAEGDTLVPAGQTEFAKDKTFGYESSHLGEWIEEKTAGRYEKESVVSVTLEDLRQCNLDKIRFQLLSVRDFQKVVVNALSYTDLKVFSIALLQATEAGKRFLFRSAASFTRVLGGVAPIPLLNRDQLVPEKEKRGGLIIVGSYVQKTTDQLTQLRNWDRVRLVEFDQQTIVEPPALEKEVARVLALCEQNIRAGLTTAVYTKRERMDLKAGSKEEALQISVKISDAVTSIVQGLKERPGFLIAKGGITSSDVGTKGLGVKKALVAGQIRPGIPVWILGEESKFPGLAYIIFPGNVGSVTELKTVTETLMGETERE